MIVTSRPLSWVATAPCSLGWLLVASSTKGLGAVHFGDDPDQLRAAFPPASASGEAPADDVARTVERVVALVEDPRRGHDFRLDPGGSAFEQSVWLALLAIPAGRTMSYGALAANLGDPAATRAVAHAGALNPLAVVIPCHRLVGADGDLTGYRWGLHRKRALLAREAGQANFDLG